MSKWKIRRAKQGDHNLILSYWLNSFYHGSALTGAMSRDAFYKPHEILIKRALIDGVALVACDPLDEEIIYGFIVGKNGPYHDILHYIMVKESFQGFGIAKELVKAFKKNNELFYTHLTKNIKGAMRRTHKMFGYNALYSPYIFFMQKPKTAA